MADFFPGVSSTNQDYIEAMQQSVNPSSGAPKNELDQTDFLRLLTTQLRNQDPSKPMDPTNFVTDLTQMNQLEATTRMNESIKAMTQSFQSIQTMQAASIIGKNVQVNGEDFSHSQGMPSQFNFDSDVELEDVKVVISDADGIVKELDYGNLYAGEEASMSWDGMDRYGESRPDGVYSLTVFGTDAEGELQAVNTIVGSRVNSVSVNKDGTMSITLATGEKLAMDAVREISG